MIDYVNEVIPGKSAKGYKNLSANEWFFKCHFPGDPSMPGMLQMEALIQMLALTVLALEGNKGKVIYIANATNMKFARKVLPGDVLAIETELLSWKRGIGKGLGKGFVKGTLACKGEFTITDPEVIKNFNVKR